MIGLTNTGEGLRMLAITACIALLFASQVRAGVIANPEAATESSPVRKALGADIMEALPAPTLELLPRASDDLRDPEAGVHGSGLEDLSAGHAYGAPTTPGDSDSATVAVETANTSYSGYPGAATVSARPKTLSEEVGTTIVSVGISLLSIIKSKFAIGLLALVAVVWGYFLLVRFMRVSQGLEPVKGGKRWSVDSHKRRRRRL